MNGLPVNGITRSNKFDLLSLNTNSQKKRVTLSQSGLYIPFTAFLERIVNNLVVC